METTTVTEKKNNTEAKSNKMKETWNYERLSNLQLLISGDDNNNNSGPVSEYCKWNQSADWYKPKADGIGESSNR